MRFALDFLYLLALVLASPWVVYRSLKSGGWRDLPTRLGFVAPTGRAIWLHGSSVGEVRLIALLVRLLEQDGHPLVITSHTVTGVRAARLGYPQHFVFRFPFDLSVIQRRLIQKMAPKLVVIVESDLWPNQLLAAEKLRVPVVVINAKLSERSFRLHQWSRIVPRALKRVSLVAAQTDTHASRFKDLGVPAKRVVVTGNMKYDLTVDTGDAAEREALRRRLGFTNDDRVVIGGSLHPREDEDLIAAFAAIAGRGSSAGLVLVPRYPDLAPAVARHADAHGYPCVTKRQLDEDPKRRVEEGEIVIVDTLGELRSFYAAADIAFVGGSLYFRGSNKGGHNLMEPAILGLPVIFGPYNLSFRETVADLLLAEAGVEVRDRDELSTALGRLVDSETERRQMGERARQVVLRGQGASQRNLELMRPLLDSAPGCSPSVEEAKCRHQPQTQTVNE